jgi:ketosteroid isomerase-like protein
MTEPDWVSRLFAAIDAEDTQTFASFLSPDAVFRFGNAAPVHGLEGIREYVREFFGSIRTLRHQLIGTWDTGDAVICQGIVSYTRHDGSELTVPFANIFRMRDGKIGEYLVYIDASKLYGAA